MKFDMGKAWSDATALLKANREVLLIVAGVFSFLPSAAMTMLVPQVEPPVGMDQEAALTFMLETYEASSGWISLLSLVQTVGVLALLALLRDARKPTVGEALKTGIVGLLPYIGTYLLAVLGLMVVGGILVGLPAAAGITALVAVMVAVCAVGLIYLMIKMSMVSPIIAIEKTYNPLRIIARSWSLTKGNSLRLLSFYALLLVVYFVIAILFGMVVAIPVALLGEGTVSLLLNGVISGLMSAIFTVIGVCILAAIHRQLAGTSPGAIAETFE